VPAFAKVNLGLEVLRRRRDGYHELRTVFQTVDLCDDVVLTRRPRGVEVSCDHPEVPGGRDNLAVQAARLLKRRCGVGEGVQIDIVKRIPVAGGLGGGSSDAAAVLLGLSHLWDLALGPARLHDLARRLGADVPFFLLGGTALGVGRGDEVYPLRSQLRAQLVIVDPKTPVPTRKVFARLGRRLTPRENSHTIFHFVSRDLEGVDSLPVLANDLERAALEEAPELAKKAKQIRWVLDREGARLTSLSGSGSSYFGVFAAAAPARQACVALADAGFEAVRAQTLTLDQYRGIWARSLERGGLGRGQTR